MGLETVEMYKVVCDYPDCGVETQEFGEYMAWGDHGAAIDEWVNAEGQFHEGRALCPSHAKPFCYGCDEWVDEVNDDDICARCAEDE